MYKPSLDLFSLLSVVYIMKIPFPNYYVKQYESVFTLLIYINSHYTLQCNEAVEFHWRHQHCSSLSKTS